MEPIPSRPSLPPGYGIEKATGAPGERLPWSQVAELLATSRNYWVCTTRPDGRPHAKPVWGIWLEGQFVFSTHPETVTARNLRVNAALVVHLESGDQVTIVEGTAKRIEDRALLARFGAKYEAKYDWPLSPEDLDPGNPTRRILCGPTPLHLDLERRNRDRRDHHALELRRPQLSRYRVCGG